MQVWRMEHVGCPGRNRTHGPIYFPSDCIETSSTPAFGFTGNGPSRIEKNEICGVTDDQMDMWWWQGAIRILPEDWAFVEYELSDSPLGGWREDNNQIVFDPAFATRRELQMEDA